MSRARAPGLVLAGLLLSGHAALLAQGTEPARRAATHTAAYTAPAPADNSAYTAPAAYEDRLIEGLPPPEADGETFQYDRSGWPRFLRLETRLGTLAFDESRRARIAYAIDTLVETPNHGVLSADGSVAPNPRQHTLTLRQRELPLPGGWRGDHDIGLIASPATGLAHKPSRVMLPNTTLQGLRGQWRSAGDGLQLLAASGEPGQLTSLPTEGFDGLGGRRNVIGAQWQSQRGADSDTPTAWALAVQHERATDVLDSGSTRTDNDGLTTVGRTDADASHLALRHEADGRRAQFQALRSRTASTGLSANGYWFDGEVDEGPRRHGLSLYRLEPALSWAALTMPSDLQGATLRTEWRTRQWSADISYDWLRSITGRLASGSYGAASARWRLDRDNQLNIGGALRDYGGRAWNAFTDWRHESEWGSSGLRLELGGGADASGPAQELRYDQDWANPLGWSISSTLGLGRYAAKASDSGSTAASQADDNYWLAALALQAPVGNRLDLRGQVFTEQRDSGLRRHTLNLGGRWRLDRHWSLGGQYTRSLGAAPVRRPIDPLAPVTTTTSATSDRSFQAVLSYETEAGSRVVPLGGGPQEGGGRIEGVVYYDANRSGTQDASETGVAGVTVALDNRYGVRTDAQGRFVFAFVAAGPRTISIRNETLPLPWSVVDEGQVKVEVRLRETTRLSLPVQQSGL